MFGIYPRSHKEILAIIQKYESIEKVIIYGSRAKGTQREGSDIDITLLGEIANEDFNKFLLELDDSYIPYKFDISIYNNLNSESLKEHIDRVGKIFYKKDDQRFSK